MPEAEKIIIHDISTTEEVIPDPGLIWWQWTLIALGVLLLLTALYFFLKNCKQNQVQPTYTLTKALQEISSISIESQQHFSVELSLIIRKFLQHKVQDPSLFETQEEINDRALEDAKLPESIKNEVLDFLEKLNYLKYEQTTCATANYALMQKSAKELLKKIRHHV